MGIYKIKNKDEFYKKIVKINAATLDSILSTEKKNEFYSEHYTMQKKSGVRTIYKVPHDHSLYKIQKRLKANFLDRIMLADSCYGFRKNCSYLDYLNEHSAFYNNDSLKKKFLRLDIKDFFGSISQEIIREVFAFYLHESEKFKDDDRKKVLQVLQEIVMFDDNLVQGALTSPSVSNIIFRQLDLRIEKYCSVVGVTYTRYADDMLFSSYDKIVHGRPFLRMISEILTSKGFTLNYQKVVRNTGKLCLNGYVLDNEITLSRKKLTNIRRLVLFLEEREWKNLESDFNYLKERLSEHGDDRTFGGKYNLQNYLNGYRSYLVNVLRYMKSDEKIDQMKKLILRIEKQSLIIDKHPA